MKIFNWIILFLYMLLIFYFSSLEKIEVLENFPEFNLKDKFLHVVEFCILGFFAFNAFKDNNYLNKNIFLYTILFATFYGITNEIYQIFIPNRTFSFLDIFADFIGGNLILIKKFI